MTIQIKHDLEHRWLKILCVDGSGSCEHSNWIWCLFIGVEVAAQKGKPKFSAKIRLKAEIRFWFGRNRTPFSQL